MTSGDAPAASSPTGDRWIGTPLSGIAVAAIMGVAIITSITTQVTPLLLSALANEGRIAVEQIGQVATAELLTTGALTALLVARLPYGRLRPVVTAAALVSATANVATALAPSFSAILACRLASGAASGVFMWLLIGMFTRSMSPGRINGLFLAIQGAVAFVVASIYGGVLLPRFGPDGAFVSLAGFGLLGLAAVLFLPSRLAATPGTDQAGPSLSGHGWIALASILIALSGILGIWVHLPPLAVQFGYSASTIAIAVPLAIGLEVLGGLCAAALAAHGRWLAIMVGATCALGATVAMALLVRSPLVFTLCTGTVGFLWMFINPIHFTLALAADPDRRALPFVGPVQLIGCGVGPFVASMGVRGGDVTGAFQISASMLLVSLILVGVILADQSRRSRASIPGTALRRQEL